MMDMPWKAHQYTELYHSGYALVGLRPPQAKEKQSFRFGRITILVNAVLLPIRTT